MISDDLIRPSAYRDIAHPSYFQTIGRALAVAQHFEMVCRAVADLIDIRCAGYQGKLPPTDEDFSVFVKAIRKRMLGGAVKTLCNLPGFQDDLDSILNAAKDARNRIAHECTVSAFHPLADEEAMWRSLESLFVDIRSIAEADGIVCALLWSLTEHERLLIPPDYNRSITDWVFEEFQGEGFLDKQVDGEPLGAANGGGTRSFQD